MCAIPADDSAASGGLGDPGPEVGGVDAALQAAIDVGYDQRDRADMAPTIAYFRRLLEQHPENAVVVYEVAGAYDTSGDEETALGYYERALSLGLGGDVLRRCLCQYASTLRWLGRYDDSLRALERAQREFPDSDAVSVFRALTLNDAGNTDAAVAELLALVTRHDDTDLGRWRDGLRGLAEWLAEGRPD
jgi:tetratricopeptide (TPR) repeat protein